MIFQLTEGNIFNDEKLRQRDAMRAVIIEDDKILMIHTNKGDYKFPGGGRHHGESDEETLIREVREETGYQVTEIKGIIGTHISQSPDSENRSEYFRMNSYYYQCSIDSFRKNVQQLDDYEKEQEFSAIFVTIKDAITNNEVILTKSKDINPWVERETTVLKILFDNIIN